MDARMRVTAPAILRRYECAVCWSVYDPAAGDATWQVPAGTPFEALPPHWTCPRCGTERERFLEANDE